MLVTLLSLSHCADETYDDNTAVVTEAVETHQCKEFKLIFIVFQVVGKNCYDFSFQSSLIDLLKCKLLLLRPKVPFSSFHMGKRSFWMLSGFSESAEPITEILFSSGGPLLPHAV